MSATLPMGPGSGGSPAATVPDGVPSETVAVVLECSLRHDWSMTVLATARVPVGIRLPAVAYDGRPVEAVAMDMMVCPGRRH